MLFVLNDDITSSPPSMLSEKEKRTDVIYVNKHRQEEEKKRKNLFGMKKKNCNRLSDLRDQVSNYPMWKMNNVSCPMNTTMKTRRRVMIDFDINVELIHLSFAVNWITIDTSREVLDVD